MPDTDPDIRPRDIKNRLATSPSTPPRYSVKAKRRHGETVSLADPTITRALVALMDMNAALGGAASHFGGPSAFAEVCSAAFGLVFDEAARTGRPWHEIAHIINDAGHCENGIYALKANYGFAGLNLEKLKQFRSINSPLTGHGESHLFPEGVFISNGPLGSSLPQAQGLAMADALARRSRMTVTLISDGACMEGEAKEALAAIPGFADRDKLAPFVLVISDNNTKLSGRIDQQAFSMEPTFASLAELGWRVLRLEKGHDLQECVETLEEAFYLARENPNQPIAVHAKTIKGYGVRKTEESASGGHGFPVKSVDELRSFVAEILGDRPMPQEFEAWISELAQLEAQKKSKPKSAPTDVVKEKVQVGVARAMIAARTRGLPVVSVTSDLPGSTGVAEFRKSFPKASFDVGVAEANMVSAAAGFSKLGFIPVVDTFAQFGVTKGSLPLIMAALSDAPMIAIFSHAGFQDAADGASHQCLSYFAMAGAIPHTDVYSLSCSSEAEALVAEAITKFDDCLKQGKTPRSSVFFLGREDFPRNYGVAKFQLGQAQVVLDTTDGKAQSWTIAACGSLIPEVLNAAEILKQKNIGCIVVNPSVINHPDIETFKYVLDKTQGRLLTVEDHQMVAGMGAQLCHALLNAGVTVRLQSLGVRDDFGRSSYTAHELHEQHHLDANGIANCVIERSLP